MWLNQPSLTLRVLNLFKNVASHYFYYFQFTNFPPTTIESLFLEVTDNNNKKITMVGITIKNKHTEKPASANDGFSQTQKLTGDHTLGLLRNPRRKSLSISRYSFLVLLTVDKMITLLSCPWNSSTLPTLISSPKRFFTIIFWIFCTLPWKENSN